METQDKICKSPGTWQAHDKWDHYYYCFAYPNWPWHEKVGKGLAAAAGLLCTWWGSWQGQEVVRGEARYVESRMWLVAGQWGFLTNPSLQSVQAIGVTPSAQCGHLAKDTWPLNNKTNNKRHGLLFQLRHLPTICFAGTRVVARGRNTTRSLYSPLPFAPVSFMYLFLLIYCTSTRSLAIAATPLSECSVLGT